MPTLQQEASSRQVPVPPTKVQGVVAWTSRDELGVAIAKILLNGTQNLAIPDGGAYAVILSGLIAVSLKEVEAAVSKAFWLEWRTKPK